MKEFEFVLSLLDKLKISSADTAVIDVVIPSDGLSTLILICIIAYIARRIILSRALCITLVLYAAYVYQVPLIDLINTYGSYSMRSWMQSAMSFLSHGKLPLLSTLGLLRMRRWGVIEIALRAGAMLVLLDQLQRAI